MKKLITLGLAALAAGATFAAANDLLITFSTPGPDKYADGSVVLDGERYALCWSQDFSQFAIKADGTAEGGKVVLKAPIAKGGRCPTTVFEIDAAYAAKNFAGGEWAVYLLDTRTFGADGAVAVSKTLTSVNTAGLVGTSVSVGNGTLASLTGASGEATELPAGAEVPRPQITGIRVVDGSVLVTVKGTVPYLAYGLAAGSTPDAIGAVGEGQAGAVSADEEITLVTSAKEGSAFFKVGRK